MKKSKKVLKTTGIIIGSLIGFGIICLAYVGAGQIFVEEYHDPDYFMKTMLETTRYGWSLKLNDGWAA